MKEYEFNTFALPLAERLGNMAMQRRYGAKRIDKEDGSPTTNVDIDIENMIKEELNRRVFDIGFMGEETSQEIPNRRYFLCVDPIDGTTKYLDLKQNEGFSISMGLYDKNQNRFIYGLVHNIPNNNTFCNGEIFQNGRKKRGLRLEIPQRVHIQGSPEFKKKMRFQLEDTTSQIYTDSYPTSLRMIEAIFGEKKAGFYSNSNRNQPWDVGGGYESVYIWEVVSSN
jgi:fructose-1,6-bisphosphatase/inositol monophosphatase family enzyme